MEINSTTNDANDAQHYQLEFHGKGSEYFAIMIVNWLMSIITLGLYYPWARAKRLRYVFGQTSLNNQRFHFSGTGKEMFKGFIAIIVFYIFILVVFVFLSHYTKSPLLSLLFLYASIFAIIPFAIHGSLRYRMSRTSYRGVRFGYRGNRNELVVNFYKWIFLTIITFGIYGAWMQMNIRRYTHENIRYGDVEFSNDADGADWFFMNLQGYLLTLLTLGIYLFRWQSDIFSFYIDNMVLRKDTQTVTWQSASTGMKMFKLISVNLIITVFTLGFGKAWADMRTQKFICDNILLEGNINIDEVVQTEENYTNASGEGALDFLDIDLA